jgi:peroxygenase
VKPAHEPAPDERTALRRHTMFFDRNGDGLVTIDDVATMLRLLGCSDAYARINAIGGMLARTTSSGLLSCDVVVQHAHRGTFRCPHLSGETRIFDRHGRFDPDRFDEVLARYGRSGVDGLTESDITAMIADISIPGTITRSSSSLAFRLLMTIAGEPGPEGELMLTRARLRAFYEGDLLPALSGANGTPANPEPVARTLADVIIGASRVIRAALVPAGTRGRPAAVISR